VSASNILLGHPRERAVKSMELTLNLLWMLLAIPALWVWQSERCEGLRCERGSLQRLLILGCILIMLFPVVSATDDLQAMRPEIEEPGARDALTNPDHGKASASPASLCNNFALRAARFQLLPQPSVWALAVRTTRSLPAAGVVPTRIGRAPPLSCLG